MNRKLAVITGVGLATALVGGCGSGGGEQTSTPPVTTSPAPPVSTVQSLTTELVLAQAQHPSETATPYTVDDGQLVLTDTSETSDPISINGT
jgi:hypothetical protein